MRDACCVWLVVRGVSLSCHVAMRAFPDVLAPSFLDDSPSLGDVTKKSARIELRLSEAATVHYVLATAPVPQLHACDVVKSEAPRAKLGCASVGAAAFDPAEVGTATVSTPLRSAAGAGGFALLGELSPMIPNTDYVVAMVASDFSLDVNVQTEVTVLEFTTRGAWRGGCGADGATRSHA